MTNNEMALKLKLLARKARFGHFDLQEFITEANPANILVLLSERDADKMRIAELEREKEAMTAVALAMRDDMRDARSLLESRTVTRDAGVMNIGNPYCEDYLVAWTVSGKSLLPGIYYLDARFVGGINMEAGE